MSGLDKDRLKETGIQCEKCVCNSMIYEPRGSNTHDTTDDDKVVLFNKATKVELSPPASYALYITTL